MELGAVITLLSSLLIGVALFLFLGVAGSCGGYYTASSGAFHSPGYPGNYPNYADCSWHISSGGGMNIRLTVNSIDVEAHTHCGYDGIRVYDGGSTSSPLIETMCGSTTKTFFSRGSDLTIVFFSDGSAVGQGFVARWDFEEFNTGTTWPQATEDSDFNTDPTAWITEFDYTTEDSSWTTDVTDTDWTTTTAEPTERTSHDFNTDPTAWITEFDYTTEASSWTTDVTDTDWTTTTTEPTERTSHGFSCYLGCNYVSSICSCNSSCQYNGNCCYDYYDYCHTETTSTTGYTTSTPDYTTPTTEPSCRWNCGANFSSCSCSSSCQYNRNCCQDYYAYCFSTTESPTTESPSCRWNCGYSFSSCSCDSSCQYYGNCCHDYHLIYCYIFNYAVFYWSPVTAPNCGGSLFGSGFLSSPNYPNYYHDNAYCVWRLSALPGEKIFLSFVDLELQDCCGCDYVNVYDGSTTASPLLGNLCFNSGLQDFHSSSSYLTVLFRSDYSVVARGFKASYSSSLPSNTARVKCSSDRMIIEIRRSYLESLGISWHNLYVDDHRCRPSANSYEVSFNFPVGQCGTNKKFYNGRVVYNNNVRAAPSQSGEITRTIDEFLLNVTCHMEQDTTAGTVYKAKELVNSTITGTGRFNATMSFFPSPSFSYPILEHPYEVKINQNLYVQVQLTRADNTLDVFLETCEASPNHNFDARVYTLLRNGCEQDKTVEILTNGRHYYAQFSFKAFKFLRTHAFVFLQCRVLVCADNDYGSRCRRGCLNRTKRSLDSAHHTEVVTLGPITLKGSRSAAKVDVGK
ncbi:CUB and zona pellucida-like domain-containing protein 1 isoform X1 [Astyanax mexicanus]|uniref:CUB and zona pellucida-like domain-containing protein 1 isoform X1 n=1 Tax=Astyanax mexicanus TaxID=7994 RepID=A0A8T2LEH8_ASTMX|nr:CUB and zona pellucida-like domain-containing protein 1 isoform X1 [Astyanax mexicanus]